VLDDADEVRATAAIGSAAFANAGQACSAAERVLVLDQVSDRIVDGLVEYARGLVLGDPREQATTMGPLNNEGVAAKMDSHVGDAQEKGARIAFGGHRREDRPTRLYYEPTVLADVPLDAAVSREETFGPIAPVTTLRTDAEILAAANASQHGLSSAVFTRDLDRAFWFAERLQTGQVTINDTSNYWELHLPFGGWAGKASGRGRVGGRYVFDAFTQIRSVAIHLGPR
jgi:acyl-CoA reductase-like NAD-dependent aldehyde dehydrogenase